MRLLEYLQKYNATFPQGGEVADISYERSVQLAHEDLKSVQKTNEFYFRIYMTILIITFLLTIGAALIFRAEMGGLVAVLGSGGVIQGGLLIRLANELKEKMRIETVASLSRSLPPEELKEVLMEILKQINH